LTGSPPGEQQYDSKEQGDGIHDGHFLRKLPAVIIRSGRVFDGCRPGGRCGVKSIRVGAGTSRTGHVAIRTKRSATLPSKSRWKPRRPWVPITTRSAFRSSAATSRRWAKPSPYRSTSAIRATPLAFFSDAFSRAPHSLLGFLLWSTRRAGLTGRSRGRHRPSTVLL